MTTPATLPTGDLPREQRERRHRRRCGQPRAGMLPGLMVSAVLSLALAACGSSGDPPSTPPPDGHDEQAGSSDTGAPTTAQLRRLELVRGAPEQVGQACRRAARRTTLEVVCPPVAPEGRHSVQYAGRLGGRGGPRDSYSMSFSSESLHRATDPRQPGHWAVAAAADAAKLRAAIVRDDRVRDCRVRRSKGLSTPEGPCAPVENNVTVAGTPVTEYRMPGFPTGGVHGGHIVFVWRGRDADYLVSVHDPANRARGLAITDALVRATT